MTVLSEVEGRLDETGKRIEELIDELERQKGLEQSLADASRGLGEAADQTSRLVASSQSAVESLGAVLVALREAVEVLKRADPAATVEAVLRVEEGVKSVEAKVAKAIDRSRVELAQSIEATVDHLSKMSSEQTSAARRARIDRWMTLATLVIVLGMLCFELARLFGNLG